MTTDNAPRIQRVDDSWSARDCDSFDNVHDTASVVDWQGREAAGARRSRSPRRVDPAAKRSLDNCVHLRPYDILLGNGDFSCFITRCTGTFSSPLAQPDGTSVDPAGKPFDVLCPTAAKWPDGRIVEEYLFYDNGSFLHQVGLAGGPTNPTAAVCTCEPLRQYPDQTGRSRLEASAGT